MLLEHSPLLSPSSMSGRQQVVAHNEAQEHAYRRLNSEGKKPTYSHMVRGARVNTPSLSLRLHAKHQIPKKV